MEIVCVLTSQLDGEISLERNGGTCFVIEFPMPPQEAIVNA